MNRYKSRHILPYAALISNLRHDTILVHLLVTQINFEWFHYLTELNLSIQHCNRNLFTVIYAILVSEKFIHAMSYVECNLILEKIETIVDAFDEFSR